MMKKTMDDGALRQEYHRFISSGLLAVYSSESYKKNGGVVGLSNVFLGKWVTRVLKQKRYKKEIGDNIVAMVNLHESKKRQSGLFDIFQLHFQENKTHNLYQQEFNGSDLERVGEVKLLLQKQSWVVNMPLDYDPSEKGVYQPEAEKEVFSLAGDWLKSICDDGAITQPLRFYSTEVLQEVVDTFYERGFYVVLLNKSQSDSRFDVNRWYYCFDVYPYNKPINGMEIPTVNKYL